MITKEKIVEILQNKWNRSNLLYSEIADEICKLYDTTPNIQKIKSKTLQVDYEILETEYVPGNRQFLTGNKEIDELFSKRCWKIKSIKRLSDGEVFTIGDRIMCGNSGEIKPLLKIELSNCNDGIYLTTENYYGCPINKVIKAKKLILVTKDGKEIYEDTMVYGITNKFLVVFFIVNTMLPPGLLENKIFSTKEAAEEYILLNKPCLSYNDLINSIEDNGLLKSVMTMRILKLVKSKLK